MKMELVISSRPDNKRPRPHHYRFSKSAFCYNGGVGCRPRAELSLNLNSFHTSPNSDGTNLSDSNLRNKVKRLDIDSFQQKIKHFGSAVLAIDCRSLECYNMSHVRRAMHVNVTNRINRRRLQTRKATLVDLASSKNDKDALGMREYKEIVVYDDSTIELNEIPYNHILMLILASLVDSEREPSFLISGYKEFHSRYKDLCEKSLLQVPLSVSCPQDSTHGMIDNHPLTMVLPFLYLGNSKDAADPDGMAAVGITHVLNVTTSQQSPSPTIDHQTSDIVYKRISVLDNSCAELQEYFEEALEFIAYVTGEPLTFAGSANPTTRRKRWVACDNARVVKE